MTITRMNGLRVISLLLWVCAVYFVGIYLFVGGFLLVRLEVNRTSTCGDVLEPRGESKDFCGGKPRFRRAVLIIIDALRIDFTRFDPNNTSPQPFENKIRVIDEITSSKPTQCRLYPFRADPPTTTMQRIKGLTTGSLPTFVDIGNNFASAAITDDNLIHQFGQIGKRVVFMGDDTWENLFPKKFHRSLPFHSFNTHDLDTVDDGILQNLYKTLVGDKWDVVVAHFLGVDHCGHKLGPDHPRMADKLIQMDGVIRSVIDHLQNDTLLVVMGDHGMTDTGDHGGESQKETEAALFLYSSAPLFPGPPSKDEPDVVPQIDLVPTLALLLGAPIPYSSVGQVLLPLFPSVVPTQGAVAGLTQLEALPWRPTVSGRSTPPRCFCSAGCWDWVCCSCTRKAWLCLSCCYFWKWGLFCTFMPPQQASATSGGFNVPWTPVVLWSLAATQFFHATGHLPAFPAIQWGAAFVGFPDGHTGTLLPATLVTLNTFASHILFAGTSLCCLQWDVRCSCFGPWYARSEEAGQQKPVEKEERRR